MTIRTRLDAMDRQINPQSKARITPSVVCLTHLTEDGGWMLDGQPIGDQDAEALLASQRHDLIIVVRDYEDRPVPGAVTIQRSYGGSKL